MAKVFISPSTQDWNKYKGGSNEEAEMRDLSVVVKDLLMRAGHSVMLGGTVSWSENVKQGNAWHPDIYVALHSNAGGGLGTEVIYRTGSSKSKALASAIYKKLAPVTVSPDRGLKSSLTLGEVRGPNAPACIVECAFHDKLVDANDIKAHHDTYGLAIAQGILAIVGGTIPEKKPATGTKKPPKPKLPTLELGAKNAAYVRILQKKLNADRNDHSKLALLKYGWKKLDIDGDFGKSTLKAVKAAQKVHKLNADGVVGPDTWKAIS